MKKSILAITILCTTTLSLFINGNVYADPRIEQQDICHYPFDAADTDNEDKDTCGNFNIMVRNDRVNALSDHTIKEFSIWTMSYQLKYGFALSGQDSNRISSIHTGKTYTKVTDGSDCVIVTQNYNAGTGQNDRQEYRTKDWTLDVIVTPVGSIGSNKYDKRYILQCNGGQRSG